jgi:hypothetical protein
MRGKLCVLWLALSALASGIGCQSVRVGPPTDDGTRQRGTAIIPAHGEQEVYYPVPFLSPPNLLTKSTFDDCMVIEQKPDHFRIKNPNPFSREVSWEARGLPVTASAPVRVDLAIPPTRNSGPGTEFANANR